MREYLSLVVVAGVCGVALLIPSRSAAYVTECQPPCLRQQINCKSDQMACCYSVGIVGWKCDCQTLSDCNSMGGQ